VLGFEERGNEVDVDGDFGGRRGHLALCWPGSGVKEANVDQFGGKIAVVTGAGTGMGRELVRQLAAEGCHVAMCDISTETMDETKGLALADAPDGTRVTAFAADVADEEQMVAFAAAVAGDHATDHINLLFNNAGIGGGGSFVADRREEWDKTFAVCWGGVYNGCRAFMPMLLRCDEGHVVNTSSLNGFWASLGPNIAHTAYSAAKFAVKGFTEALITDFRLNAPHLKASVVMPGHIGTSIAWNSMVAHGRNPKEMTAEQLGEARVRFARMGMPVENASDEDIRAGLMMQVEQFRDNAPLTAAQAATIILDGVRRGDWRILVGEDARLFDIAIREDPVSAYEPSFVERLAGRPGGGISIVR
jgi:NAD(P)-dependent dehydrogenase (short-subunit alcohol dehydrogenase family)